MSSAIPNNGKADRKSNEVKAVPQIFINDKYIGDYHILSKLDM